MARKPDEYKPLSFYKKHTNPKRGGFSKFEDGESFYFCRYVDGDISLISQVYTSAAGRNNGIKSVKENEKLADRVIVENRDGGKWGLAIKAGNGQEVAISPDLTSKAQAERLSGRLRGVLKGGVAAAKTLTPKKAAAKKAAPKKASPKKAVAAAAVATAASAARAANDEQNYKPLAFYKRHTSGKKKGFESFEQGGQHYFAYFENDKIALISEGYPTKAAHDTGLTSVKKNMSNPDRYKYRGPLKKSGKYDYSLRAGNHKEIARSPWFGSAAAAATGAAYIMGKRRRTAKVAPPAKPKAKPIAPVAAVAAAATVAATPAMAKPAVAPKVATPVAAAPVAVKPKPVAPPPSTPIGAEGAGIWGWLKWLLLGLLALLAIFFLLKMCKPNAAIPPPPPAMVACWDGSEAETENTCPTKVTCWDDSFATSTAACPAEPPKVVEPISTPAKTYSCWDGSSVTDIASCPVEPSFTCWNGSAVRYESECPAKPVRQSATATSLFNPPAGVSPISVKRLGTNPEFGNSHSLTAEGFCSKLASQYVTSDYDRKYLNYLASELGYNSFDDVPKSACSEATMNYGTTGILGYGSQHGLQYSTLNVTDPLDLEAFQIMGANGRVVYFMKTCGNYFFPTN